MASSYSRVNSSDKATYTRARQLCRYVLFMFLAEMVLSLTTPVHAQEKSTLKVEHYHIVSPEFATTRSYNEFQQQNPHVKILPFASLRLATDRTAFNMESTKLLCFAGHIGPDVLTIPAGSLNSYRRNRFIMDLSGFVGQDRDGDGYISDEETIFEPWKSIPPVFRQAVTIDGKPFGLPLNESFGALLYRKDLLDRVFRRSRIKRPPQSWDELYYLCQKACEREVVVKRARYQLGRRGIYLSLRYGRPFGLSLRYGSVWDMLVWSAGGHFVEAGKQSPTTGKWYWFAPDEWKFIVLDSGENLARQPTKWRASFASPQGLAATHFLWKLIWAPWISDPVIDPQTQDHEPINLTMADVQRGSVVLPDGREVNFEKSDVNWGVCRGTAAGDDVDAREALANGEVVFTFHQPTFLFRQVFLAAGVGPNQLGFCPFPSSGGAKGRPVVAVSRKIWGLSNELLKDKRKMTAAFQLLKWLEHELPRNEVRQSIDEGHGAIVSPKLLAQTGFSEYIDQVPPHLAEIYPDVSRFWRAGPFVASWDAIRSEQIGGVLAQLGASNTYDYRSGLKAAQEQANRIIATAGRSMDESPTVSGLTRLVVGLLIALAVVLTLIGIWKILAVYLSSDKPQAQMIVGTSRGVSRKIVPWLLLLPALGLIAMWQYYPMLKGSVISIQDYSIAGQSQWVGLGNFLGVLLDPRFYKSLFITFKFTALSLLLGFSAPILLALLLDEVPRFKFTFRMIYLLPNVCAGLVIIFLWKMMFYPTEAGFINSILLKVNLISEALRYYQDPDLALLCCILPSVWASAGIGSLIYLAALKSVPTELYEAAEVDGANIRHRLWHITVPTIKPLIIIQFIGAFIGTFHTMGNIFVMTGGGPDGQTTVLALKIWKDAFIYLNFGMATATAWVLGIGLIGFTIWQLSFLKKVEFRRAETN